MTLFLALWAGLFFPSLILPPYAYPCSIYVTPKLSFERWIMFFFSYDLSLTSLPCLVVGSIASARPMYVQLGTSKLVSLYIGASSGCRQSSLWCKWWGELMRESHSL